jgi:hypothetical protein
MSVSTKIIRIVIFVADKSQENSRREAEESLENSLLDQLGRTKLRDQGSSMEHRVTNPQLRLRFNEALRFGSVRLP